MFLNKPPLGVPLDWSNPLNDGLVLHLAMNEGYGDKVYDLSGYGNHGTLNNMAFPPTVASGWNPGRNGVALQFDGVDDYINCGNDESLNIMEAVTVEAWIKANSNPSENRFVVTKLDDVGRVVYGLRTDWSNNYYGMVKVGGSRYYCPKIPISLNVWYHLVMTYDGETVKTYLDGEFKTQNINPSGNINTYSSSLSIGYSPYWSSYWGGSIDDVRIYNRALSAAEILERYINPYGVYLDEDDRNE